MEKIILDCDPGHDDAIAILLAAGNPKIDLLGITTVSGNHNVENTTRNALSVCTAYGIKVPVAKGSPGPLIIDQVLAVEIHGDTGLDGPDLPPASFELDKRHAVDFIIVTVFGSCAMTVSMMKSTACRLSSSNDAGGSSGPSSPVSPWISTASTWSMSSGPGEPFATGTLMP